MYAQTWRLVDATGLYGNSLLDERQCHCCQKGRHLSKPLFQCTLRHRFVDGHVATEWLCLLCLRHTLKMNTERLQEHVRAQRGEHNERVFKHLLDPLRGECAALIDEYPYVRKFMQHIEQRDTVPRKLLALTAKLIADEKK